MSSPDGVSFKRVFTIASLSYVLFTFAGLQSKYSGSGSNIYDASKVAVYIDGPAGIHVLVSNEVLNNIKDESLFAIECQSGKVLMKAVYKNEIN